MVKMFGKEKENEESAGAPENAVAIAQGIQDTKSEPSATPEKKPRKPYTRRLNSGDEQIAISDPDKNALQSVSALALGKISNAPLRIAGLFLKHGDMLPFNEEMEREIGKNASVVVQGFFPITKETEKYYALTVLASLYTTVLLEQFTKWKLATAKNSNFDK